MPEFPVRPWPSPVGVNGKHQGMRVMWGLLLLLLRHNFVSYLQLEGENPQLLMKAHSQRTIPHQSVSPPSWSRPSLPFGLRICSALLFFLASTIAAFISTQQNILPQLFPPLLIDILMKWPGHR